MVFNQNPHKIKPVHYTLSGCWWDLKLQCQCCNKTSKTVFQCLPEYVLVYLCTVKSTYQSVANNGRVWSDGGVILGAFNLATGSMNKGWICWIASCVTDLFLGAFKRSLICRNKVIPFIFMLWQYHLLISAFQMAVKGTRASQAGFLLISCQEDEASIKGEGRLFPLKCSLPSSRM